MYTTLASGELLSFFAVFRTSTFTPAGMTTSSRTLLHSNTTFLLGSCMPSLIHRGQTLWYLVRGPFSMSCAQASLYLAKSKLGGWPNSPLSNLRYMASLAFWLFDGDGVGLLMTVRRRLKARSSTWGEVSCWRASYEAVTTCLEKLPARPYAGALVSVCPCREVANYSLAIFPRMAWCAPLRAPYLHRVWTWWSNSVPSPPSSPPQRSGA